jgi:hypothetical protein
VYRRFQSNNDTHFEIGPYGSEMAFHEMLLQVRLPCPSIGLSICPFVCLPVPPHPRQY